MQNREEDILRYLNDQMTTDEKAVFEQELIDNKTLREEVGFQRDLLEFFAIREPELEAKLGKLGDEFIDKRKTKNPSFILISAAFIFVIILLILLFNHQIFPKKNNNVSEPKEEIIDTLKQIETVDSSQLIEPSLPPLENNIKIKNKKLPPSGHYASLDVKAFERNPMMESIIQNQYRTESGTSSTTVVIPKADEIYNSKKILKFRLDGFTKIQTPLQLYIYSNDSIEIENDDFILSADLKTKREGDKNTFYYDGDLPSTKGLYYYTIKNKDTGELMHISRFTIQ